MTATKKIGPSTLWGKYNLSTWLFIGALIVYLATRLIGLSRFPIYFFTDEANQTLSIALLADNEYRADGVFLPTYFANGLYYNLGLSVYMQWLPYILFGKSAVVTRVTSVLITLIAAVSVGLLLRDIFKLKHWWMGTLFLSITPAWFLHSRTAFETVEFVSFYAGFLSAYLYYRHSSPRYLYVALFLAACAFYTYSPAQLIVPLTVIALAFSDLGYHLENRRTVSRGLLLVIFLSFPYLRFIFYNPHVPLMHLSTLGSYWMVNAPFLEKLRTYLSEYAVGLSPWYWYIPNIRDLSRHLMKDYGHIMLATLPFAVIGLVSILRNLHLSANRAVLIAMLVSPVSAALAVTSVTRSMLFVIPACILTAIGFERVWMWMIEPGKHFEELDPASGPDWRRVAASLIILLAGGVFAFMAQMLIDRIVIVVIAVMLSLQVSGVDGHLARRVAGARWVESIRPSNLKQTSIAISVFILLSSVNIRMLNDALRNSLLWFTDYGLGGMQYGSFQIFDIIEEYKQEHPDTKIILSPEWTNGADVLAYFFLDYPLPIRLGSIRAVVNQKLPLDDSILFVIPPDEYRLVYENPKFSELHVEKIVPYPDGNPGFYFVRLRYSDDVDEILAAEAAARRVLLETNLTVEGEEVQVRYSRLDSDTQEKSIALLFDGDPLTMANTYEANPFVVEITYPSPRGINGFSVVVGSASVVVTLTGYAHEGAEPVVYTFSGRGTAISPELNFELPAPLTAQVLRFEQFDVYHPEPSKIHIWELTFR